MLKKYLLFDIDGTLVNTGGAGLKAMKSTVKNILGNENLLIGYSFAGKTDAQIMNDMIRKSGLDDKLESMSKLFEQTYIENLKTNLKNSDNFRIYPNVNELLDYYQKNEGFELALNGKKRQTPPTEPILDGKGETKLISMRLGKPPAGYGRWTLKLLADELVALEIVESISYETVRRTLKKMA